MSEEQTMDTTNEEEIIEPMPNFAAPGLQRAHNPSETDDDPRTRRRNAGRDSNKRLRDWIPRTRLGRMVLAGQVTTFEEALATRMPIREVEIIDALLPDLEEDIIKVNMVQRMTDSGRRVRFNVMACIGNKDGYIGLAMAKGKEVAPTIHKAIDAAKLSIISIQRGNGSWESSQGPGTSVPFKATGQAGSTRVTLMPAAKGKGLVIGEFGKRVLTLAGVTDVLSRTKGQTRTTINYAQATFNALVEMNRTRITDSQRARLYIHTGRLLE